MARLTTKELSERTWPDYVRFFSQGNGWDHCGCVAYQGFIPPAKVRKWADKRDWSLEVKCTLLDRGLAHGVLVYANGRPVGWCQFGPKRELPVPEAERRELLNGGPGWKRRRVLAESDDNGQAWRITCFCTDKQFSQRGVAGVALGAALDAIRKRGGGLVEAFPIALVPECDERVAVAKQWRLGLFKLIRAHGRFSDEVERYLASPPPSPKLSVAGIGEVDASGWVYGLMHAGTVGMFEQEGFTAVSAIGSGPRVRMQRIV